MNTKHTPGPWAFDATRTAIVAPAARTPYDDGEAVVVVTLRGAMSGADTKADTRLIAAAPDLLAALETIARQCGPYATHQPALDYATIGNIARSAIAKATGHD